MINMMILYDFVVENLCVTIVIREEGSSQLSELKSFWIAFGALATKLRQSVLSKSAPGFSKWIIESSGHHKIGRNTPEFIVNYTLPSSLVSTKVFGHP